jgi:ribosomal protein S18 acetylase RimI-like enzyme
MPGSLDVVARRPADAERLFTLAKMTFGGFPGWSDHRVRDALRRDLVFVAREDEQAAGYVALRHDEASASIVVEQIFVAPGHERHGVGRLLLRFAESYALAEDVRALRIVAERANWRARDFYRRSGFVPIEDELLELSLRRPQRRS